MALNRNQMTLMVEHATAQELMDSQAFLTVPMLAKIWNVSRVRAWRKLTDPRGPFFKPAFRIGDTWQIETTAFKKIISDLKAQKGEP